MHQRRFRSAGAHGRGSIYERLVPEREPWYEHTLEGDDDSPAHIKATLTQPGLTIPIDNGRANLGVWQGVYLFEHRSQPRSVSSWYAV